MARVRYLAWRTAIPWVAWTNGTMAVQRRGSTAPYDDIEGALTLEYRAMMHALADDDFYEGVWAVLIDKNPATTLARSFARGRQQTREVERHFDDLGDDELRFQGPSTRRSCCRWPTRDANRLHPRRPPRRLGRRHRLRLALRARTARRRAAARSRPSRAA